jgi:peptidoglycan/LPS O-acetylase OafA/YrhL
MSIVESAGRLKSVDALRAIAALAVIGTHIPRDHLGQVGLQFLLFLPLDFGALGVPLFIVISGFCIHLAVAKRIARGAEPSQDWFQFWRRRFYRLYPTYLAAIAFSVAIYAFLRSIDKVSAEHLIRDPVGDLTSHLLMVHNLMPRFSSGLFNPPFWTLALEEQLYALFPLLLILRRRMSALRMVWIVVAVSILWRMGIVWIQFLLLRFADVPREAQALSFSESLTFANWGHWPFAWWILWALGALAAEAYTGAVRLPAWCYNIWVAAAMAIVSLPIHARTLGRYTEFWLSDVGASGWIRAGLNSVEELSEPLFSVACFIVLNRWCRLEQQGKLTSPWFVRLAALGAMTYSIYLVHQPVVAFLEVYLPLGPNYGILATAVRTVVYVPICLAVAWVFFMAIERHFLAKRK